MLSKISGVREQFVHAVDDELRGCRRTGSVSALTITSGPMPAGSPMVIAMVGRSCSISLVSSFDSSTSDRSTAAEACAPDGHDRLHHHVTLNVKRPADRAIAEPRDLGVVGIRATSNSPWRDGSDGQADAVEGDSTLSATRYFAMSSGASIVNRHSAPSRSCRQYADAVTWPCKMPVQSAPTRSARSS